MDLANIEAAIQVAEAGYPLGFIIAPIYLHDGWDEGYLEMFDSCKRHYGIMLGKI